MAMVWTPRGFPGGSEGKESVCNSGNVGLIPEWGRSSGGGHGNPLQYSCLEKSMGRGAWWTTVGGSQRVRHDWVSLHPVLLRYFTRSLCWADEKTRENVKSLGPISVPPRNSFSVVQPPSQAQHFVTPGTGLPDPQHLPEFAQVHVHWIGDAIQPSHPVSLFSFCLQSFPASASFPLSGLFASGGQILELQQLNARQFIHPFIHCQ